MWPPSNPQNRISEALWKVTHVDVAVIWRRRGYDFASGIEGDSQSEAFACQACCEPVDALVAPREPERERTCTLSLLIDRHVAFECFGRDFVSDSSFGEFALGPTSAERPGMHRGADEGVREANIVNEAGIDECGNDIVDERVRIAV